MKNITNNVWSFTTVKLLAKILWILAIVFTMTACSKGSGGSASGGGVLTINGLEEFNGNWINGSSAPVNDEWDITVGYDDPKIMVQASPVKISGGSVKLSVMKMYIHTGKREPYNGNDTVTLLLSIKNKEDGNPVENGVDSFFPTVTFANGNATITWKQ